LILRLFLIPLSMLILSCCSTGESLEEPRGNEDTFPVYNQAYQENYETDSFDLILREAENAYILLDPFQDEVLSQQDMNSLLLRGNMLSAYISIGTGENWRSDYDAMKPYLSEKQWGEWEGEYYVSLIEEGLTDIMKNRIDQAAALGFDWLEFDNMDWIFDEETRIEYSLESGETEALAYIEELREYAGTKGLKCMSKNWRRGAENFNGVTFESGSDNFNWWDSDEMQPFLDEGKPVIIVHYNEKDRAAAYRAYRNYMKIYGDGISFICETRSERGYIHFNN
jgi:cysteinyl-tRNA synthetase, unknown class